MRRVAIRIAVVALMIPCVHAAPADFVMTEERNAAVGFSATQQMVMAESLVSQCGAFKDVAEQAGKAHKRWTERNAAAARTAWDYLVLAGDAVSAQQGANAATKFHADRKAEFAVAAKRALLAIFKDGIVDAPACRNLAVMVDSGAMDISGIPEHDKVLQQIDAELHELQKK